MSVAQEVLSAVEDQLVAAPPAGFTAAYIRGFFRRFQGFFLAKLAVLDRAPEAVAPLLPPGGTPPDLWTERQRTAANLAALRILAAAEPLGRPLTAEEAAQVLRYSGWGGLSIRDNLAQIPEGWRPEEEGLIHEYYTPTLVAREVARVVQPLLAGLAGDDGLVQALEPSAGIGRFVHSFSGPGFEAVRWTAVEFSRISGRLLRALRPDVRVFPETPFEKWVAEYEPRVHGKLGLVVSNPPYGPRGGTLTDDPNREYREQKAYAYFLRRAADLLRPQGLSVFLIPYGFLTGRGAAQLKLRQRVLRRHHLSAAFRLPSGIFPGALLVTDLLFFRARGGEVSDLPPEDLDIQEGNYYELYPQHILGREVGKAGDEDEQGRKPRWGYEVRGDFTALPPLIERPFCTGCAVRAFYVPREVRAIAPVEDLAPRLQLAVRLGARVARFLAARAAGETGEESAARQAAGLYDELRTALLAYGPLAAAEEAPHNPHQDTQLQRQSRDYPDLLSFLSAFAPAGGLADVFGVAPTFIPRYLGTANDAGALATYLYQQGKPITLESLLAASEAQGGSLSLDGAQTALQAAGWCRDGEVWLPEQDYYSGYLWDRYDRARAAAASDPLAAAQAARLLARLRPQSIQDIAPDPRLGFIPLDTLREWLTAWVRAYSFEHKADWRNAAGGAVPPLAREGGLLRLADVPYIGVALGDVENTRLSVALGWLNHDLTVFRIPGCAKQMKDDDLEETATEAQDRCRSEYAAEAKEHFLRWLSAQPAQAQAVEDAYNRSFIGFVAPEYSTEPLPIARWGDQIDLKPHQRAGARRLLQNGRGLLAFDTGVGKTFTGIATIARARELGQARRPLVICPNSLVWQWEKSFRRALPDFRVVVLGSKRWGLVEYAEGSEAQAEETAQTLRQQLPGIRVRLRKSGKLQPGQVVHETGSELDTPEERAAKWRAFQAGAFDVAIVNYSTFARNQVRKEEVEAWLAKTPSIQRELSLTARNRLLDLERAEKSRSAGKGSAGEKREAQRDALREVVRGKENLTEREEAVLKAVRDRWVAELAEGSSLKPDPGIFFGDLGVDFLVVDEAQNFKNLFSVGAREGGVPKYLGAIQEGSDRAWNLAVRCHLIRQRTGGTGVCLLSATPAKNSPIEYFSLLSYLGDDIWRTLGILDAEQFVDRYLKVELKTIINQDLQPEQASVVTGFMNLPELRTVLFRYAEFKTAEQVGLKLPSAEAETLKVALNAKQSDKYQRYLADYKEALSKAKDNPSMRYKALGLLQKMALVTVHEDLDEGPVKVRSKKDGEESGPTRWVWTWDAALAHPQPHSPKIDLICERVLARPSCGHIIFCDNIAAHAFVRNALVDAGMKPERIAVLNAVLAPTPAERLEIAEKFNGEGGAPVYDVVIANQTAYEGIDLQVRTCEVYHLDLPWEPATLQQRNGRAVRYGNSLAVVGIRYLLAQKSFDVIRFQMIAGKVGWMKDIVSSADRETSNPAADEQLSPEEMTLLLAQDEDAARAAIEEQKRQRALTLRKQVARQAWRSFKNFALGTAALQRVTDPILLAQRRQELEEAAKYLLSLDAEVWPHQSLVGLVREGVAFAFVRAEGGEDEVVLWEGMRVSPPDAITHPFEVGRVFPGGRATVREFGAFTFRGMSSWHLQAASWALSGKSGEIGWSAEQEAKDLAQWQEGLRAWTAVYARTSYKHWRELQLDLASWSWRNRLWQHVGVDLLRAVATRVSEDSDLQVPLQQGDGVRILPHAEARSTPNLDFFALPGTRAGWDDFLARARRTLGLKYGEVDEATRAWFGERMPKGVLPKAEQPGEQPGELASAGGEDAEAA